MKKVFIIIMALCATTVLMAQKKVAYHAFINAGIGCYYMGNGNNNIKGPEQTDGIYSLTLINGVQIGERFYIGVGLSWESLMTARGWSGANTDYKEETNIYYGFPVFIDAKWYLRKMTNTVTPYLMLDMGYEAWRNDPFGNLKNRVDQLYQNCFYFNGGFGLHISRYADISWTAGLRDVQMRVGVEL